MALVECVDETMIGYVLHINKSTRPSLVTVEEAARQPVNEKVRDGREGRTGTGSGTACFSSF